MRPKHESIKLFAEIDTALRIGDKVSFLQCMYKLAELREQLTEQEKSVVDTYARAKKHYRNT